MAILSWTDNPKIWQISSSDNLYYQLNFINFVIFEIFLCQRPSTSQVLSRSPYWQCLINFHCYKLTASYEHKIQAFCPWGLDQCVFSMFCFSPVCADDDESVAAVLAMIRLHFWEYRIQYIASVCLQSLPEGICVADFPGFFAFLEGDVFNSILGVWETRRAEDSMAGIVIYVTISSSSNIYYMSFIMEYCNVLSKIYRKSKQKTNYWYWLPI